MTLPPALQTGIDELVRGIGPQELERSSRALSDAYRAGGSPASRAASTAGEVAAYLATRAPATYAAAAEVFGQIRVLRPDWAPASVLDLGAGPGIATWAALEAWREIAAVALVEAEAEMARAGRTLAEHGRDVLRRASWTVAAAGADGARADLVVVSYVIGELQAAAREELVRHAWERTADTLVIIEPGTTAGYRRTLAARAAADRRRWLDPRTVPPRRALPAPRGRLVPLLGAAAAEPNAPTGQGRRARLRGREVRVRRPLSRAPRTGRRRACSGAPTRGPGMSCSTSARPPGSSGGPCRRRRATRTGGRGSFAGATLCDGGAPTRETKPPETG